MARQRTTQDGITKAAAHKTTMADYTMPLEQLEPWLQRRAAMVAPKRRPLATSLAMLDGYVSAIVADPLSFPSPKWMCPLLGVEPDAFNHDTEEFAAIAAVGMRHNVIRNTLATAPKRLVPLFSHDAAGALDLRPWCTGFCAAMNLRRSAWAPLLRGDRDLMLRSILRHADQHSARDAEPSAGTEQDWYAIMPALLNGLRLHWMPTRFKRSS
ncbi:UPF0149 family protein [Bradyrhizobium sp. Ai1a-2]|uniref:UPF0149 family protein n=1 Tax=Bradyrhizobium sp. Ai1a-2 TaxID=196490 RepID=UPI0004143AB3|nr:UPF0149 family protein [Bradyrhizobium sp. Ai1a-2]